jgi:DNA-binding response OmpR family regulator
MAERLLMIEDDAALAQLVREYLGPLGFSVSSVGTAAEGLRRVEADSFDAVLLDVMLPDLDGIIDEVLEASRLEARGPAARREPVDVLALLAREDG